MMFFQVVIPLAAFGRLIIHTGAMAEHPVLDKELEKELLPSGLHASLLIRATDRRRKYSSATDQYRKQNRGSKRGGIMNIPSISNAASSSLPSSSHYVSSQPSVSNHHPPRNISLNRPRTDSDELTMDASTSSLLQNPVDDEAMVTAQTENLVRGHRRMETANIVGSDNFFFLVLPYSMRQCPEERSMTLWKSRCICPVCEEITQRTVHAAYPWEALVERMAATLQKLMLHGPRPSRPIAPTSTLREVQMGIGFSSVLYGSVPATRRFHEP
jgi:hypothetical protein